MASPWAQQDMGPRGFGWVNNAGNYLRQLTQQIPDRPIAGLETIRGMVPDPPWPRAPIPTYRGLAETIIPQSGTDVALAAMPLGTVGKVLKGNLKNAARLMGEVNAERTAVRWADELVEKIGGHKELYSEMSPENLTWGLLSGGESPIWSSPKKHLALGMGKNKGVRIKFDPAGLGQPHNTRVVKKPGAMGAEDLEFQSLVDNSTMVEAIREVAVAPGTKMRKVEKAMLDRLTKGWTREKGEDGWTIFTKVE